MNAGGSEAKTCAGIFVGGASRRMGGRAKGLLASPDSDEPLVARTLRVARGAGLEPVLVGDARAYAAAAPGEVALADAPSGIGPLGGLAALLAFARARGVRAVALACDMPHVSEATLARLAADPATAAVVAPRRSADAPWEPLFARYDPERVLPALEAAIRGGVSSFQRLLAGLEVAPFSLEPTEMRVLVDWDEPADMTR